MLKWVLTIAGVLFMVSVIIALPFKNKTTLSWDAVITNVDGTPATDLSGYKVYHSKTSGLYTDADAMDVGNVTTVNIKNTFGELKGVYCFVATAYDVAGNESDFSNEVCDSFVVKKHNPENLR